jgi:hypothetical protein
MNNKWTGLWNFYVGRELTPSEIKYLDAGGELEGITVYRYKNVILKKFRERVNEVIKDGTTKENYIRIEKEQLGTGTTPATEDDTELETPDAGTKKNVASVEYSEETITITSYWADGDATGEWKEYGLYVGEGSDEMLMLRANIDIEVVGSNPLTISGIIQQTA